MMMLYSNQFDFSARIMFRTQLQKKACDRLQVNDVSIFVGLVTNAHNFSFPVLLNVERSGHVVVETQLRIDFDNEFLLSLLFFLNVLSSSTRAFGLSSGEKDSVDEALGLFWERVVPSGVSEFLSGVFEEPP